MNRTGLQRRVAVVAGGLSLLAATTCSILAIGALPAQAASGSISDVSVQVTPQAAGYGATTESYATYAISFIATDGITGASSGGDVTIQAPAGTIFASFAPISFTDHTNPADDSQNACNRLTPAANIWAGDCSLSASAGDSVTLVIESVINPTVANDAYTLQVSTDSDPTPVTSHPYRIAPEGYWLVGSDGGIFTFGREPASQSSRGRHYAHGRPRRVLA